LEAAFRNGAKRTLRPNPQAEAAASFQGLLDNLADVSS
jgi:hypothetical protein